MSSVTDSWILTAKVVGVSEVVRAFRMVAEQATAAEAAIAAVSLAAGAGLGAFVSLERQSLDTAASFQVLQARLNALYGSASKGGQMFQWVQDFARTAPMSLSDVVSSVADMKALGLDAQRDLRTIGDTASALGLGADGVRRITIALGQMMAAGRVDARELRELIYAGVPVYAILNKQLGLTGDQIRRIGQLGINSQTAVNALLNGMDEHFGGGMALAMKTLTGQLTNLKVAWQEFLNTVGQALLPFATKVIQALTKILDNPETVQAALYFTAYIVAGLEAAYKVGRSLVGLFFDPGDAPAWMYRMKAITLDILGDLSLAFSLLFGMTAMMKGSVPSALASLAYGAAYVAAHKMAYDANQHADMLAKQGSLDLKGLKGLFSNVPQRAMELYTKYMFGHYENPVLQTPGVRGTRGLGPLGATPQNQALTEVQQVILGGAERARRGVRGLDLGAGYRGTSPMVPSINIRITPHGGSMDRAVDEKVAKGVKDALSWMFGSTQGRAQLRAALAAGG